MYILYKVGHQYHTIKINSQIDSIIYICPYMHTWASQVALMVKNPPAHTGRCKRCRLHPWAGKTAWREARQLTLIFLPGESHGHRSLTGYSPSGPKESDTTEATEHTEACILLLSLTSNEDNSCLILIIFNTWIYTFQGILINAFKYLITFYLIWLICSIGLVLLVL